MDISNPNLNILLITPGRTGSHMIVNFFKEITKITPFYIRFDDNQTVLRKKTIKHSHYLDDIKSTNEDTFFIFNVRNPVEILMSNRIARITKKWVYFNNLPVNITPEIYNKTEFLNNYQILSNFYLTASKLLPINTKIVDYKDFKDNINNLFEIFNVPKKRILLYDKKISVFKTPGSHKDWILNYDEIMKLSESLEQDPLAIMGKGSNAPLSSISV